MSIPNVPSATPSLSISRTEAVHLLLASIAFEELGLAHVINAEAEKIQAVLGMAANITELLSVNESADRTMRTVLKTQMLLQFKLEETTAITTESTTTSSTSSTTTTSFSTTTTSISTTTSTVSTATTTSCDPALIFALFANRNFTAASASTVNANTQVNGMMTVTGNQNTFLGDTNVVGAFSDAGFDNSFESLSVGAAPVPILSFDANCLQSTSDLILPASVTITSQADAASFQGRRVWVNGTVTVAGAGIAITGGGILASGGITISGDNFTYTSTGCFALYSRDGAIRIDQNGPYNMKGLVYTASAIAGDIELSAGLGGKVCGAVIAARDILLAGGCVHDITNVSCCSPCIPCSSFCRD